MIHCRITVYQQKHRHASNRKKWTYSYTIKVMVDTIRQHLMLCFLNYIKIKSSHNQGAHHSLLLCIPHLFSNRYIYITIDGMLHAFL